MTQSVPVVFQEVITEYGKQIRPAVTSLMGQFAMAIVMVPFLVALLYFSNARTRRSPMFACIIISILFSWAATAVVMYISYQGIFTPFQLFDSNRWIKAEGIFTSLSVLVVDVTLLFRMLAVYPYESTRSACFLAIFTPTVLFKLARVALLVVWTYEPMQSNPANPMSFPTLSTTQVRLGSASFVLTTVDNIYASLAFLWKLRTSFRSDSGRVTNGHGNSTFGRVRSLFWIALTNFVFPAPICIAAAVFSGQAFSGVSITPVGFELAYYSNYVGVVFAAFATVWSSSLSTRDRIKTPDMVSTKASEHQLKSARGTPNSLECNVDTDVDLEMHQNYPFHDPPRRLYFSQSAAPTIEAAQVVRG